MRPRIVGYHGEGHVVGDEASRLVETQRLRAGLDGLYAVEHVAAEFGLELRRAVHQHAAHAEVVVGPLGTIYYRAALHGHAPAVGLHMRVGLHHARLHVEVYLDAVTLAPAALDGEIALVKVALNLLSVYRDRV